MKSFYQDSTLNSQQFSLQLSISSTFYSRVFCTRFWRQILKSFVLALRLFGAKILYKKFESKTLMKLTAVVHSVRTKFRDIMMSACDCVCVLSVYVLVYVFLACMCVCDCVCVCMCVYRKRVIVVLPIQRLLSQHLNISFRVWTYVQAFIIDIAGFCILAKRSHQTKVLCYMSFLNAFAATKLILHKWFNSKFSVWPLFTCLNFERWNQDRLNIYKLNGRL